jgi:hypothetical protein
MARVRALQRRYAEGAEWFAKARAVLDVEGWRPLRAICDYDEALMYLRRGEPDDRERARPLLAAALQQFQTLGMTGWCRRAEQSISGPLSAKEGNTPTPEALPKTA